MTTRPGPGRRHHGITSPTRIITAIAATTTPAAPGQAGTRPTDGGTDHYGPQQHWLFHPQRTCTTIRSSTVERARRLSVRDRRLGGPQRGARAAAFASVVHPPGRGGRRTAPCARRGMSHEPRGPSRCRPYPPIGAGQCQFSSNSRRGAIGGTLTIHTHPGAGVHLHGHIPT